MNQQRRSFGSQWLSLVATAAIWGVGSTALAGVQTFNVVLDGAQEVPPLAGVGSGQGIVSVDDSTGDIKIAGRYTGMTSNVVAAHLHGAAPPGSTAGVILGLNTSGGQDGTFDGTGTLTKQQLQDLLAGLTYLNVHTVNNGSGEIRGQVCPKNASWTNYDAGWPGTNGVPGFAPSGPPIQGTDITLKLGNSLGAATTGFLLLGSGRVSLPTGFGGKILVLPTLLLPIVIPAGSLVLPVTVINDPNLCGVTVNLQALENDPGASHGLSFTAGLEMVLGS